MSEYMSSIEIHPNQISISLKFPDLPDIQGHWVLSRGKESAALKRWLKETLWVEPVGLKSHGWRSKVTQHFPRGEVNQKHSGREDRLTLVLLCRGRRRREWGFPWHCGPNTIPSLSQRQIAAGVRQNSVATYLCGCFVGSLNNKCREIYLPNWAWISLLCPFFF